MKKVCRKTAIKTGFKPLFNFGKQPKTANACKGLLKIRYILKKNMKKLI